MQKQENQHIIIAILRIATFALFAGRAWQHLFWDAPFRALLWDQNLMEGIVTLITGGTWQEYVTSESGSDFIDNLVFSFGIFYALMALITLFVTKNMNRLGWLFILSSIALVFLSFLYFKSKFYYWAQFLEYAIQFSLPFFFYYSLTEKMGFYKLEFYLKIAIALTFISHGLFALGYYPQPGVFVDMVINFFGISESSAKIFLYVAGVLDIIFSILIFFPKLAKISLIYLALWGGATALARIWTNFYPAFPLDSLHQYLHATVYRLPHMLVPLAVLLIQFPNVFRFSKSEYKPSL